MSRIRVKSERIVNAEPEHVYTVLSDYKEKRPLLLTANFLDYKVEKGGHGNGTVISYRLQAAGRERLYHMRVNEPVPGRVITEQDSNSSLVTTWTLSPLPGGRRTQVSVDSEWEGASGVGGFFERTFAPLGLQRIYSSMLDQLMNLVAPDDTGEVAVLEEENKLANASVLLLMCGVGIACAIGIRYWLKAREREE